MYTCRKTYGHEQGLSCTFRQHRAKSHCAQLHGYALSFSFEFGCRELDNNGWVVDFGSLKPLKEWLGRCHDHVTVMAEDDPALPVFEGLADLKYLNLHVVPRVGCEAFARTAAERADALVDEMTKGRAHCISCTVAEHGGNSATYHMDRKEFVGMDPVVAARVLW